MSSVCFARQSGSKSWGTQSSLSFLFLCKPFFFFFFFPGTGLDCFYRALLWVGPCGATSLLGAVGESPPQGVCQQKLAGLGMGLSRVAGEDLAVEENLGESQELAFSLVQLKPAPACFQGK